jgi:hypothetical protein
LATFVRASWSWPISIRVSTIRSVCRRQKSRSAADNFGRPPEFPDRPFRGGMDFTLSHGVIADSIQNNAFTLIAGIVVFQLIGNKLFS